MIAELEANKDLLHTSCELFNLLKLIPEALTGQYITKLKSLLNDSSQSIDLDLMESYDLENSEVAKIIYSKRRAYLSKNFELISSSRTSQKHCRIMAFVKNKKLRTALNSKEKMAAALQLSVDSDKKYGTLGTIS